MCTPKPPKINTTLPDPPAAPDAPPEPPITAVGDPTSTKKTGRNALRIDLTSAGSNSLSGPSGLNI